MARATMAFVHYLVLILFLSPTLGFACASPDDVVAGVSPKDVAVPAAPAVPERAAAAAKDEAEDAKKEVALFVDLSGSMRRASVMDGAVSRISLVHDALRKTMPCCKDMTLSRLTRRGRAVFSRLDLLAGKPGTLKTSNWPISNLKWGRWIRS